MAFGDIMVKAQYPCGGKHSNTLSTDKVFMLKTKDFGGTLWRRASVTAALPIVAAQRR